MIGHFAETKYFVKWTFNFICVYLYFWFNRFDFDSQAVSPPAHDEPFFYIRYPTGSSNIDKNPAATSSNTLKSTITDALIQQKAEIDTKSMVQHTEPCKKILNNKDRGE